MLSQEEFDSLINDSSKRINGDITWSEGNSAFSVKFRAEIITNNNDDLFVQGSWNSMIEALSYHLVYRSVGRIYGLDMGKDHRNPDGKLIGEVHKHRWTETYRDKQAYKPLDIKASASQPLEVWQQFCKEAGIVHNGTMYRPPELQLDLFV